MIQSSYHIMNRTFMIFDKVDFLADVDAFTEPLRNNKMRINVHVQRKQIPLIINNNFELVPELSP